MFLTLLRGTQPRTIETRVTTDGVGVRIEPETKCGHLVEVDGQLVVVASSGRRVTDREVREAMDAGRR